MSNISATINPCKEIPAGTSVTITGNNSGATISGGAMGIYDPNGKYNGTGTGIGDYWVGDGTYYPNYPTYVPQTDLHTITTTFPDPTIPSPTHSRTVGPMLRELIDEL